MFAQGFVFPGISGLHPALNHGIDYQPQLVNAGFLNHQQYVFKALSGSEILTTNDRGQACFFFEC